MSLSLLPWIALALLVFWSVGAYNRLMRLRSDTIAAFRVFDAELQKRSTLLQGFLPPPVAALLAQPGAPHDEMTARWAGLHGATAQFAASLAALRQRPLSSERAAALSAAKSVLDMAWQRMGHDAHDLAGPAIPEALAQQWQAVTSSAGAALDRFNESVARYNAAIGQFPALLLAWLFDFRPARPI